MSHQFHDPHGTRYGIPTYPWQLAPDGLATYVQLRRRGLRPGGQDVAAQIMWRSRRSPDRSGVRTAFLYRVDLAVPVRPMTPAKWVALERGSTYLPRLPPRPRLRHPDLTGRLHALCRCARTRGLNRPSHTRRYA